MCDLIFNEAVSRPRTLSTGHFLRGAFGTVLPAAGEHSRAECVQAGGGAQGLPSGKCSPFAFAPAAHLHSVLQAQGRTERMWLHVRDSGHATDPLCDKSFEP